MKNPEEIASRATPAIASWRACCGVTSGARGIGQAPDTGLLQEPDVATEEEEELVDVRVTVADDEDGDEPDEVAMVEVVVTAQE